MTPTNELRFVRRWINMGTVDQRTVMILQQKWHEQVIINVNGDPDNQITEWRHEWRDVPVAEEE